jgi:two-component system invasion response regulator UvrY
MTVRVVVADDRAPFRAAARTVLGAAPGFELVGEASSGEEALEVVASVRPDLVLMDVAMAGMGGIEAARAISASHPATTTILVSTYREEELPAEARTCGAAAYLNKADFDRGRLRDLWAEATSRPRRGRG